MSADFDRLRERLTGELAEVREHGVEGAAADRLREFAEDVWEALEKVEVSDPELYAANADLHAPVKEAFGIVRVHVGTKKVEQCLDAASEDDQSPAWDAVDALALLPDKERAIYTERFKQKCKRLNLNEYRRALAEKKRENDKNTKRSVDEDGRPAIVLGDRPLRDVSDDAFRILAEANDPPTVFVRGGRLVLVRRDEHGRPLIERMGDAHVRGRLTRIANFVKPTKEGDRHVSPPDDVIADLIVRGEWRLPALEAIVEAPVMRPDGSIVVAPGYDAATRLILSPAPGLEVDVSERPARADVEAALGLLDELLRDFPFDSEADRANALGFMLTPILRPAIAGSVPLALVDAPKAGNGKGLLVNVAATIATGRSATMFTPPSSDDEWTKTLLSIFAEGSTFVAIDEADELRSKALSNALTESYVKGRILGRSETLTAPVRATWAACGNNVRARGDLVRRTYSIRLDAKTSQPHERAGFLHPNLLAWAYAERGRLLGALLTLARAWIVADRPKVDVPAFGSFEEWASTVGGVLHHAGIEGFLTNLRESHRAKNEDDAEWEAWLRALLGYYVDDSFTTRDVEYAVREHAAAPLIEALPNDLSDTIGRPGVSFARRLGKAFAKREGTRFGDGDLHIMRAGQDTRGGTVRWTINAAGLQVPQVSSAYPVCEMDPPQGAEGGVVSPERGARQTGETRKPADAGSAA